MVGLEEFKNIFGHITITTVIEIVLAVVFVVVVYRKFREYVRRKDDSDRNDKEQLDAISTELVNLNTKNEDTASALAIIQEDITNIKEQQVTVLERVDNLEKETNRRERNKLRDSLIHSYRYYTSKEHNPEQAWTQMESEAFWDLLGEYEAAGGDGYVHSVILPEMNLLTVVSMDNQDDVAALMQSRQ